LEVVEPHPSRSDHDAHHRVVERAYLLLEPGVLIFGHRAERRFLVFVGHGVLLAQLDGSPDEQAARRRVDVDGEGDPRVAVQRRDLVRAKQG
jgi:hypothetical protein